MSSIASPAAVIDDGAGAATLSPIEQALDLARWAPSGDNSQPWRFQVLGHDRAVVHAFDTRRHCVYDLEGHASQVSVGAMLETLRIAASAQGRAVEVVRRSEAPDEFPIFDVQLRPSGSAVPDPLHAVIRTRSVQRRPFSRQPLDVAAKARLEAAVSPGYRVAWFEGAQRRRMAWLAFRSAHIRLTIPEAYAVHRAIIEWDARFSADRVPDQALGADALTVKSMRWAMGSWERVQRMNRWFGGTLAPRLQLELVPGLRCAAHFAIFAPRPSAGIDDHLAAGAAVQRFWLTATALGLQLQPQYTPLVFADYARRGVAFTEDASAQRTAHAVDAMLAARLGSAARAAVFMGRVGHGPAPEARSLRLTLDRLRWTGSIGPG